ncbi:recombination protein RecT [Caloranaerobacter azorensis DSM 13643]|uniref:Recombination protein RecT n=1 Tax=Caloranaerobacter azorensis DSM 13643 TaxID=1121264 RepID=A0A1M5TUM8_9FIRM|nr:recombinase RecT [Caloranaerobacter azorensis]SHH54409.1 recombination protein RecT [Caloranaerobacter azorensis DSM 13643]
MATNKSLKNQLIQRKQSSITNSVKSLLNNEAIKKRFEEILKQRAPQYMSSIINLVNSDTNLQKCDPMSIIASCMVPATLDLPVDKNLGYAWIVPYGNKATFIMGYKGYIQLALRTGQYKAINVIEVHEGELISWNPLTEELVIDFEQKKSDAIIGYAGYFELLNGFKKSVYWSKEQIEKHRKKFSKSDYGWKNDYDAMAKKTVLRNMLSKWGILSVEMQKAYSEEINFERGQDHDSNNDLENIFENVEYEVKDDVKEDEEKNNEQLEGQMNITDIN